MSGERALLRARIRPMTGPSDVLDWMLLEGSRIVAVGRVDGPACGPDTKTLDLGTSTVLPALADCHVHFLETGMMELDLDLGAASRFDEVLELVAVAARNTPGRLLRAHSFDPDLMTDGRYPTAEELDRVSGGLPVMVKRRDGHSSVVNTAATELLGIRRDMPGVDTDGSGRPTGVLRREAHTAAGRAAKALLTKDERVACFRRAADLAARRGIGVVHALAGSDDPGDRDVELLLDVQDDLPIETVVYAQTTDVERVVGLGLPRIGGCILIDGSFGSRTAALSEPYEDGEGSGVLYYESDFLTGFFRRAHSAGLQISVHAIGDRAIEQVLGCMEEACGREAARARHRIEHCELARPDLIERIAELGVFPCVQPTFELLWGGPGGMVERRLGRSRAARTNPFGTMLRAGVPLGAGSDSYVTPMDSMLGAHAAMNRPNRDERLSAFEAFSLFTSGAARLTFDEARRGTLEPGKEADFVVLESDPLDADPSSVRSIAVEALCLKGKVVVG